MDWYTSEIIDGLTKLMSLSLDRTPAADLVQITAGTWIDATTHDREWDQTRDTPRIRGAFSTLARTCDKWPAPRHFLDALPPSTQLRLVGAGARPADSPDLREALAAVARGDVPALRSVDELKRELGAMPNATPSAEKEAIETDLRRHYGTDRKTQAAGADA